MASGRFAPSPTGQLHLGNLRTAALAWLLARSDGSSFFLRMEDLDLLNSSRENEAIQMWELEQLGLDWDGPVVRQSDRFALYEQRIETLSTQGLTYPCFCSRKDIAEAASAPHGNVGHYPGTCSQLNSIQQSERALTRPAALRLRSSRAKISFDDRFSGACEGVADDVVLKRNDGVPAYNLAVVVDDAAQGVREVIRGDDLLDATFGQIEIGTLLGEPVPLFGHVGLVTDSSGDRLAKRHGAITIEDRIESGITLASTIGLLAASLGISKRIDSFQEATSGFDPSLVPSGPVHLID